MVITIALVAVLAAIGGFAGALTLRSRTEFREANEVVPGVASNAPAGWAGAHSPEAKLHRRLRAAIAGAHDNPRLAALGLTAQTKQIEREALAIDDHLIAAAALPARHRDDAIAALEAPVAAVEDAVAALLASTTVGESKELLERTVADADIRLQALAQARAEVERIDRGGGLGEAGPATS